MSQVAAAAPEKFTFDKNHTEIIFTYSHVGNSTAYGQFDEYDGDIVIDLEEPKNSRVSVTIKTASVNTGVEEFNKHLRSADFFETDKYPVMTFVSTSVTPAGKTTWRVDGDLTIKGNTKPAILIANLNFKGAHPLGKFLKKYKTVHVAGFSATAQLFRSEFGLGMFAPLTSDLVNIIIETELFRGDGQ
ncbi:MAG: YceI family protein [Gammaproteobacteria bacterium]|nr:YceI family protein [Gammaproteobacteria bacterium]